MALRRALFEQPEGFDTTMGRIGSAPVGCEETEFALRVQSCLPEVVFLQVPNVVVHHHVDPERARLSYFLRRCYNEGLSKAALARQMGRSAAVSSKRQYVSSTLARAVRTGMADGLAVTARAFPTSG